MVTGSNGQLGSELRELSLFQDHYEWIFTDRPSHDRRYAIDASKINRELGWKPSVTFQEGLSETIDWFLNNEEWLTNVQVEAIKTIMNRSITTIKYAG